MSKTEMELKKGICAFCGQSIFVEPIGEVTQAELDSMATNKCMCPEAQSERRKKERKAKIEAYIKKHFNDELSKFVRDAIDLVEKFICDKISINYNSKTCTIWLDSDSYLHLKIQHREDDELKV